MTKKPVSPVLIIGLTLVLLIAAGCDRPIPQAELETPQASVPQALPTLPPVATPTLPIGEMPPDLSATLNASEPAAVPTVELFPTPFPVETPAPAELATSTPEPTPEAQPTPAAQTVNASGQIVYTVQPGDRLFSIARIYNINPYAIAQANNIPAPYYIYPGQQLIIPTASGTPAPPQPGVTPAPPTGQCRSYYVVKSGDNLFRIALTTGVSMASLAAANNITNYNLVYAGQRLCIP